MATITGVAGTTINATTTVSNAGQAITQAESSATAQSICNDLATIKSGSCTIAGNKTFSGNTVQTGTLTCGSTISFSPAVSVTRVQGAPYGLTGTWAPDATTAGIVDGSTGNTAAFELQPPHGSLLTAVSVFCTAGAGHVGLPVVMPQITLYRVHGNGGGVTSLGGATDPSLNTTGFEQPHSIVMSPLSHTVDRSAYRYFLKFSAEAGTGALSGMLLYYCDCTYSVSSVGID